MMRSRGIAIAVRLLLECLQRVFTLAVGSKTMEAWNKSCRPRGEVRQSRRWCVTRSLIQKIVGKWYFEARSILLLLLIPIVEVRQEILIGLRLEKCQPEVIAGGTAEGTIDCWRQPSSCTRVAVTAVIRLLRSNPRLLLSASLSIPAATLDYVQQVVGRLVSLLERLLSIVTSTWHSWLPSLSARELFQCWAGSQWRGREVVPKGW